MKNFIWILCLGFLGGCATASVPGDTFASIGVQQYIKEEISAMENAYAPQCDHKVINTRLAGHKGENVIENWTVVSCGRKVIYPVEMIPADDGTVGFKVYSPKAYFSK